MNSKLLLFGMVALFVSSCTVNKIEVITGDYDNYLSLTPELLQEKMVLKDDFIVVKGLSTCSFCADFKVTLVNYLLENPIPIYYYQIEAYDSPTEGIEATDSEEMELMGVLLPSAYVPSIFFFDEGQIVYYKVVGGFSVEDLRDLVNQYVIIA